MSEFFESEIVREELDKINKMQDDIYNNLFTFPSLSYEDKVEHIEKLEILLEKQRLMYTRLSLSDDLTAIEMKKNLEKSIEMLGFPPNTDMQQVFKGMSDTIKHLKNAC
jgi:hypothetical protein